MSELKHMEIRRAEPGDTDQILVLLRQVADVHRALRPDLFRPGTKYSRAELEKLLLDPARPVFVAIAAGRVAGYVFLQLPEPEQTGVLTPVRELYVDDLCVDEAWRGHRVATELFSFARAYAREQGCTALTLHVWSGNEPAEAFYRKMGMTPQKVKMELPLDR